MSLLTSFQKYFHDIDVFILEDSAGAWGTTEKVYGTADRTIEGFIQPVSGNDNFKNQSLDKVTTHRLYVEITVILNNTDRLVYNGDNYNITFNQKKGISGISDHKEIGLQVMR